MATPPEVTVDNFVGSWLLNKSLSDSFDQAFAFQGIPWIIRKLVNVTTLTLKVSHGVDESGFKTLIFTQAASVAIAGLSEEKEIRFLDGRETFHSSTLFGTSSARSHLVDLATATGHDGKKLDPFLTKDFSNEGLDKGEGVFDLIVHQSKGWVMEQVWGFGMLDGERRLMRKMRLEKGGEVAYITAWYDWTG